MKVLRRLLFALIFFTVVIGISAQPVDEIIPLYEGSKLIFDDKIGFEEYQIAVSDTTVKNLEGVIQRRFCEAPEGRSPYEIIRNYQSAVQKKGGQIVYATRNPRSIRIDDLKLWDIFAKTRVSNTTNYPYMRYPSDYSEYIAGKISTPQAEIYFAITAAIVDRKPYFEIVTLEAEPIDLSMVSIDFLNEGIDAQGKVAIYDIFFDTGKAEVKGESTAALQVIAEYLKQNPNDKYLVVGHTDSVGAFEMNLQLSLDRAEAVISILVNDYQVDKDQLQPFGIGSGSPISTNETEDGRALNRRVEIVKL